MDLAHFAMSWSEEQQAEEERINEIKSLLVTCSSPVAVPALSQMHSLPAAGTALLDSLFSTGSSDMNSPRLRLREPYMNA